MSCRWPPSTRARWPSSPSNPASHRQLADCRRHLTLCPAISVCRELLRPSDLVGAVVVLEGHGHLTFGAVDADLTVEGLALLHGRTVAVVALDVLDVLGAVAV